jgi:hypothetical protein
MGRMRMGQADAPTMIPVSDVMVFDPLPPEQEIKRAVLPAAGERVRSLCQRRPELCERLCEKFPLANAFLRSGCAPATLAGMGQDDALALESELTQLETELAETPTTTEEVTAYFTQASAAAEGAIDSATSWAKANPLMAVGVAVGLFFLLGGLGGRRR